MGSLVRILYCCSSARLRGGLRHRAGSAPHAAARSALAALCALLLATLLAIPPVHAGEPDGAAAMRARQAELADAMARSPFRMPLVLQSSETDRNATGEIYALVEHPYLRLANGLTNPANWCELLILHINIKYCTIDKGRSPPEIDVWIGRKTWQEVSSASRVDFRFQLVALTPDYMQIDLISPEGPMGTSNYRIRFEAIPAGGSANTSRSFVRMRYSYEFGTMARLAMQAYLATLGRGKVGFTPIGEQGAEKGGEKGAEPQYVGGMRGVVERNAMRYYLAIDAWMSAPASDPETRLVRWFDATERYSQQLAEMDKYTYLDMKRREIRRQRELP